MYMQDERHSSSDPNSRHQQTTEPSYLQTHGRPLNPPKSQTTDSDDPHAKRSQTENSWLQEQQRKKAIQDLERGPSCSCYSQRSKSADPPPVKTHKCLCHTKAQPCRVHSQHPSHKRGESTRTSVTDTGPSTTKTSLKSKVSSCTKDLMKPCTCGSKPPYWAGQSNVVSGPSYSKAVESGSAKTKSGQSKGSKPCQCKSPTNIQGATVGNQSTMTWVSNLISDPESAECSEKQTQSSSTSVPSSPVVSSRLPYNQSSFGEDETSATSRSRSIVGKVTCLCPSGEKVNAKMAVKGPCSVSNQNYSGAAKKCPCASESQDADRTSPRIFDIRSADRTSGRAQDNSGAPQKCTCPSEYEDAAATSQVVIDICSPEITSEQDKTDANPKCTCPSEYENAKATSELVCSPDRTSVSTQDKSDEVRKCTCGSKNQDPDGTSQRVSEICPPDKTSLSTQDKSGGARKCTCGSENQDTDGTSQRVNEICSPDKTSLSTQDKSGKQQECNCPSEYKDAEPTSQGDKTSVSKQDKSGATTRNCTCPSSNQDTDSKSQRVFELNSPERTSGSDQENRPATYKCTCPPGSQNTEPESQRVFDINSPDKTSQSDRVNSGATNKWSPGSEYEDADGTSEGISARIQHPCSFSKYIQSDSSRTGTSSKKETSSSSRGHPKGVSKIDSECQFCDCHSPSTGSLTTSAMTGRSQGFNPLMTSIHSHPSLSGGSCMCKDEEPPRADTGCQCDAEYDCEDGSGMKTPEDFCGTTCQPCATRKQRVYRLVEELSAPAGCQCVKDRPCKIQQLFRELTLLLRCESESAVAPTEEEPCSDPLPFEECCTARHEHGGEDVERPMSKKELQRVECFHELEEYLRKCFLPPPEPKVPEIDIYGFEPNPDFEPSIGGGECSSTMKNRSSVQFYDIGDGCSGDCIKVHVPTCPCCKDGEVYHDCEDGSVCDECDGDSQKNSGSPKGGSPRGERSRRESRKGESPKGQSPKGESPKAESPRSRSPSRELSGKENSDKDKEPEGESERKLDFEPAEIEECESLCDQLKTFVEKELQEIEFTAKRSELEDKTPELILKELMEGSTITVPSVKIEICEKEEKVESCVCPFAGMPTVSPWNDPNQDKPPYPYKLPIDPSVQPDPTEESSAGEQRGLLPPGPLPTDVRDLCEKLIRKALKDCGLCPSIDTTCDDCDCFDDDIPCEECLDECPDDCPGTCRETGQEVCPEKCQVGCLCCHCRALICDEECKTVSKTMRSAMCDPLCEMKYFIDSMIIDLHAMDCVLGAKQAKPQDIRANDASKNPCESFPAKISNVTRLGCSSLFVQWEVVDCRAIAGFEIYVDGHLANRFYSFRHQAGVVTNVDVNCPHQIVLRAQAVGQEFPGESAGKANQDCSCREVAPAHPELAAGSERPWSPSVYYYDPNAPEGELKC